jgi:hypothetical protein
MAKNAISDSPQSQLDKFKQAARDLECDDDDQRFKDNLITLAKAKPKKPT